MKTVMLTIGLMILLVPTFCFAEQDVMDPEYENTVSGTITVSEDLQNFPRRVELYSHYNWEMLYYYNPLYKVEIPANTVDFKISNVLSDFYIVVLRVDTGEVGNIYDDEVSILKDLISLSYSEGAPQNLTGVNLSIGEQQDDVGSICGTVHLSERLKSEVLALTAVQFNEDIYHDLSSSLTYTAGGKTEREFCLDNVKLGTNKITAYLDYQLSHGEIKSNYRYPKEFTIDLSSAESTHYKDENIYFDTINPDYGSVSGKIVLPANNSKIIMTVAIASNPNVSDTYYAEGVLRKEIRADDGVLEYPFEFYNLKEMEDAYLLVDYHLRRGEYSKGRQHWTNTDERYTSFTIDVSAPDTKDHTDKNIELYTNMIFGRVDYKNVDLVDMNTQCDLVLMDNFADDEIAGSVFAGAPYQTQLDYKFFPIKGGQFVPAVQKWNRYNTEPDGDDTIVNEVEELCFPPCLQLEINNSVEYLKCPGFEIDFKTDCHKMDDIAQNCDEVEILICQASEEVDGDDDSYHPDDGDDDTTSDGDDDTTSGGTGDLTDDGNDNLKADENSDCRQAGTSYLLYLNLALLLAVFFVRRKKTL